MIRIETPNAREVVLRLEEKSRVVRVAASHGIEISVEQLADDVAAHTPVKSGRARDAVYGRMHTQLRGEVGYAPEVKWYMRIVELSGAGPHSIIPRGRKERNRRSALSPTSQGKRILYSALKSAGVDSQRLAGLTGKGGSLRYLKLALAIGGGVKASAQHPGIKSRLVLRSRLAALQPQIVRNVESAIAERLAQ